MRRYHEILVESERDKRVGNHEVKYLFYQYRYFYYHGNNVCVVNDKTKTFKLNDCGWGGAPSTKNCLAGYREAFTNMGYKEIDPKPIYNYEYNAKK